MATQTKVLGYTAPVPKGNWTSTSTYNQLNMVRYNTATYISKVNNNVGIEPSVTSGWQNSWQLIAQDGGGGGSFTPEQQAAIDSGITAEKVEAIPETASSLNPLLLSGGYNGTAQDLYNLITYVEPTIASFALLPNTTSVEILSSSGATYTLTGITHSETMPSNILGTLTLKRGATVILNAIEPSSSSATISVSDSITSTTAQTITYTLSGTASKDNATISKNASITFFFGSYIGSSLSMTVDDTLFNSLTHKPNASLAGSQTITLLNNSMIYLASTTAVNSIKSGGFDVPYVLVTTYTYNGGAYKVYRIGSSDNLVLAGTYTYVIT